MASTNEDVMAANEPARGWAHVCPWWIGWLLASPLRRLVENPERLLAPHAKPGMKVVEPGPGMGFFSLPLARLVGPEGRVVGVDTQAKMIAGLERRARKAGLAGRIEGVVGTLDHPQLDPTVGTFDLAVAIYMVHEVPDKAGFLRRIADLLRPGGRLLLIEPKGHVSEEAFAATVALATAAGLRALPAPVERRGLTALLGKAE